MVTDLWQSLIVHGAGLVSVAETEERARYNAKFKDSGK